MNEPAIVMRFDGLTSIMWFRAIDCVLRALGFSTRGRMPLQADSTSPRRTVDNHATLLLLRLPQLPVCPNTSHQHPLCPYSENASKISFSGVPSHDSLPQLLQYLCTESYHFRTQNHSFYLLTCLLKTTTTTTTITTTTIKTTNIITGTPELDY